MKRFLTLTIPLVLAVAAFLMLPSSRWDKYIGATIVLALLFIYRLDDQWRNNK